MTESTPQSHKPPAAPVNALARPWRLRWLGALVFLALGGVLLAANLNLLSPTAQRVVGWCWPVLLLVAGLWVLLAGRTPAPAFALDRGAYTAGELTLHAGLADVRVSGLPGGEHLAQGQLPGPRGPALTVADGVARLRLTPRGAAPLWASEPWAVALAPDLPWALQAQSSLGDLTLDLRTLEVTTVTVRSALGHVYLTLPARGQAEISVRLGLGNLTLRVPEGMAVRVKVSRGRLAKLLPDTRRFVELAPGEWATPLFAVSPARCLVSVALWAGDLTLV